MEHSKEVIIVDLYNTLVRNQIRKAPYKKIYTELKKTNRIEMTNREFFNKSMMYNGNINKFLNHLNLTLDKRVLNQFEQDIFDEMESIIFNESLINELNNSNKPVAILSNLSFEYAKPIEKLKKKLDITETILSFEESLLKPDPKIFELACNRLNANPNNATMYGDNLQLDIDGANQAGYKRTVLVEKKWFEN